jgi:RNA polymerase sigma-70 factor (ECF subfamily)
MASQGWLRSGHVPGSDAPLAHAPADEANGIDHESSTDEGVDVIVEDDHVVVWDLVRLAQAGDHAAFGEIYGRYADLVYRFIYYRVHDRALAEDFTSDTFLRALRRIGSVNYRGRDIGAWLVTIARNIVLDHAKSARARLEVMTAETPELDVLATASPEDAVIDAETYQLLLAAIEELNPEQRECVTLRFIQGLTISDTARRMGKNEGAIKALQHRAIRKLADMIGDSLR